MLVVVLHPDSLAETFGKVGKRCRVLPFDTGDGKTGGCILLRILRNAGRDFNVLLFDAYDEIAHFAAVEAESRKQYQKNQAKYHGYSGYSHDF